MIRVERATPGDFERVLPVLEGFNYPRIGPAQWRTLFDYSWQCEDDTRGFMLLDGERVVGFFGAVLYERKIAGQVEKFADLTSWITLPEYRNHSLKLFKAIVSIEGRTLICVSPHKDVLPLYKRFGFRELETGALVLYPLPALSAPSAWLRYRATTDPRKIRERLDAGDRDLFDHHRPLPCGHLLIHNRREYCYIVFSRIKGLRHYFANIHHISNPPVFVRNLDRVRLRVGLAARALFVMIEARLLPGINPRLSRRIQLGHPQVYKSERLKPEQIDGLYTEGLLLNL